jgi:diphthamide synthase (EF-2-diphthine--ammonia ligase)
MLHVLRQSEGVEVAGLLTTFNEAADRVAMHAVRRDLVIRQAEAVGLPLYPIMLPWPCSNDQYESRMRRCIDLATDNGVTHIAFGDLFLEDIRDYRINQLAGTGIEPLFPIWCSESETGRLARSMVSAGLRAVVTCVDPKQLSPRFVGRQYDDELLAELPESVDPCGERGEFHTFCYGGPHQHRRIGIRVGRTVQREGFVFADVLPADRTAPAS